MSAGKIENVPASTTKPLVKVSIENATDVKAMTYRGKVSDRKSAS